MFNIMNGKIDLRKSRVFRYPEIGHTLTMIHVPANSYFNLENLKQYEKTGEDVWGTSIDPAAKIFIADGVGLLTSPDPETGYVLITPDMGVFRLNIQNAGSHVFDTIKAITDFKYACFSPNTKEDYDMYRVETRFITAPENVSDANGIAICVLGGKIDIDGIEHTVGAKITLTATVITVTPVGSDPVHLAFIIDRNAPLSAPGVPRSVSPRQIRQALTQVGLRANVEAAVIAGSQDLKDWWEFATLIERNNPQVVAMGTGLGMTATQMDDLFTLAASL